MFLGLCDLCNLFVGNGELIIEHSGLYSIKNKELQSSRIGSFGGERKTICCYHVMVRTFQVYPFPMSDVLGNSQYVTFESGTSEHILLLRSIRHPTKCN